MPRHKALAKIRRRFVEKGYPRLVVSAFLGLSGLAAFGSSAALFRAGLDHMGFRYVAAAAVGYAVFLILIRLWVEFSRQRESNVVDVLPDVTGVDLSAGDASAAFSGGASGGAGASGDWGGPDIAGAGDLLDADEAWPAVVVAAVAAAVLLGGVVALFYVIYYAPLLLAEVALDAALVGGIYRRLRKQDAGYWLTSAIRHTWKPALLIALCLYVMGVVVQWAMPTARTIGDVLR